MWLLRWFKQVARSKGSLGAKGEVHAAHYLKRELKMKILATNVLCPGGELDIVALDGDDLVFVEVRTRSSDDFGTPESSIRHSKRRFLVRSAQWFIRTRSLQTFQPRFDVIGIMWKAGGEPQVRYYRSAFGMKQSRR
jgi:putative endonuclease